MSILKIARIGHPVLRVVSEPVPLDLIPTPEMQRLFDDMVETLKESDGAGLAAPQVHVPVRVVVLAGEDGEPAMVLVNPELSFRTNQVVRSYEGCLSIPDMRAAVDRTSALHMDAFDRQGEPISLDAEGFLAIALQHECDHLDGILYVDRCDTRTLACLDELRRHGPLDPSFRRSKPGESVEDEPEAPQAQGDGESVEDEPTSTSETTPEAPEGAPIHGDPPAVPMLPGSDEEN